MCGEGAGEGLLFRSSSLGRVSVGEECGCLRGHARENGACPKPQARSAREQEGIFCISAEMRTSTDFSPYISSISISWHFRPGTSILAAETFFSGYDCFYGGGGGWY